MSETINTVNNVLNRFEVKRHAGNTYDCICPCHDDKTASLSITIDGDKILIHCFAGCHIKDILKATSLTFADLFLSGKKPQHIYQYRDKDGNLAYEKIKFPPGKDGRKDFQQRRVDASGKIVYDLKGIERVPYNYPEVLKAIKASELIVMPEGEKDAETARILGYTGSTMGGASDWKDEYKTYFNNARVAIFADSDTPGIKLVKNISKSLIEVCQSVKVVILPETNDLSDYVSAGHGRTDIQVLIEAAPELVPTNGKPKAFHWQDHAITQKELLEKIFNPISFLIEDTIVDVGTAIVAGRKKIGKSWLMHDISEAVLTGNDFLDHRVKKGSVVHLALEDGERRTQGRLITRDTPKGLPITYFYTWPVWNTKEGFNQLRDMLLELKPALVIVDTLSKVLNGKPDQNSAGDMADFGNRMHDLALEVNTMILFVAHHGKGLQINSRDPGFDIRGSSAIPGATDVNIGLYKNEDGTFDLIGEGRDIEEFDYRVKFDKGDTFRWTYEGESQDIRREQAEQMILDAMVALGSIDLDAQQIAEETGTSRPNVNNHLKRMRTYEIPSVSYEIRGKKILYSLTLLTTNTDNHNLQHLQNNISVSTSKRTVRENTQARLVSPVSDERDIPKKAEILDLWNKEGRPEIPVSQAASIVDLEKTLNNRDIKSNETEAIENWYQAKNKPISR